jgi:acetyl esterase/lipase
MKTVMRWASPWLVLLLVAAADSSAEKLFRQWDRNKDGRLAESELPGSARKNFRRVDTNRDGFISLEEHVRFLRRRPRLPKGVKAVTDRDYVGDDNPRHRLDLLLPSRRPADRRLPVLVYIHGGGWQNGDKRAGLGRVAGFVAGGRYIGVTIGYRLTDEAQWPAQIHDCKAAIRWLKANAARYGIDPDRIAVYGHSAGGHLAAMLGVSGGVKQLEGSLGPHAKFDSRVAAVVDFFGPTDFLKMNDFPSRIDHDAANSPESKLVGGAIQEHPERCRQASPLAYVTSDDAPFLVVHGTRDQVVAYNQSELLKESLERAKVPVGLLTVKNGGHGLGGPVLNARVRAFLEHRFYRRGVAPKHETLSSDALKRRSRKPGS